ncbi:MAG TPA: hypothetical protein VGE45_08255 [Chloroflexia bacterium]|jgi:hypothetical protein
MRLRAIVTTSCALMLMALALAACGPGSQDTPSADKSVPEPIASYPVAIDTSLVPAPVSTVGPTLPPATAQALATANAVTATHVALAQATASVVQATQYAVARVTSSARETTTSIARGQKWATQQAEKTQEVQATKTAFAAQTDPGATVVPRGEWGGVGIEVRVLTDTVEVRFPCDDGTTFVPLVLDSSGAFNLPGVYTSCPAACRIDIPAHFQGQVIGSQLTMTVLWSEDGQLNTNTRGPLTATLGQAPDLRGACRSCLAGDTLIDTPNGLMPVIDLREGMLVWTEGSDGGTSGPRQIATVLKTSRTEVPAGHQMVHLALADGRELLASPGHPLADGRPLGTLSNGDFINGTRVVNAERVPYEEDYTYDILPSGGTGTYWANGILIGSTLTGPATGP